MKKSCTARKEKERLTAAKLFFLSFNPMVLSRLPALVSNFSALETCLEELEFEDRKHGWEGMNCLWKIAGLMEDLFLGSQWSIILGYRRLSVKSLLAFSS